MMESIASWVDALMMMRFIGHRSLTLRVCRSRVIISTSSAHSFIDVSSRSSTLVRSADGQSSMWTEPLVPSRCWYTSSVMWGQNGASSRFVAMTESKRTL